MQEHLPGLPGGLQMTLQGLDSLISIIEPVPTDAGITRVATRMKYNALDG
jgi:hypothetical protein